MTRKTTARTACGFDGSAATLISDTGLMLMAASQVIAIRTGMMLSGRMSADESVKMVSEKAAAVFDSATAAGLAAVAGSDPVQVAQAALEPFSSRASANASRLSD